MIFIGGITIETVSLLWSRLLRQIVQPCLYPIFWAFRSITRNEIIIYMAPWGSADNVKKDAEENRLAKLYEAVTKGRFQLPDKEMVTVSWVGHDVIGDQEMDVERSDQGRCVGSGKNI